MVLLMRTKESSGAAMRGWMSKIVNAKSFFMEIGSVDLKVSLKKLFYLSCDALVIPTRPMIRF